MGLIPGLRLQAFAVDGARVWMVGLSYEQTPYRRSIMQTGAASARLPIEN